MKLFSEEHFSRLIIMSYTPKPPSQFFVSMDSSRSPVADSLRHTLADIRFPRHASLFARFCCG